MDVNGTGGGGGDYLQLFHDETSLYNRIVLGSLLPPGAWGSFSHPAQTWLRNCIGGTLIYFISGFLWCFYIYYLKRNVYVPQDEIPTRKAMLLQIYVAMKAMPWYCLLPTLSEYMVENGWTRCYSRISDVGWPAYLVYMSIYLVVVEFGIYWMHRELHDIKPLYKYLHATHHIYNKQNTLSPFAGLAFNPLDGILQAVPHVVALFLVPTHFMSHIALLFVEAIWTANIHDCIHSKLWPVMGAGYHTIHHTTYRHNYGHYTIWMDWMFGTLRDPMDDGSKKELVANHMWNMRLGMKMHSLIERHYSRLALLLHPNKNKFPRAATAFRLVTDAWAGLSDPRLKIRLDRHLSLFSSVTRTESRAPPPPQQDKSSSMTFWTTCPYCFHDVPTPVVAADKKTPTPSAQKPKKPRGCGVRLAASNGPKKRGRPRKHA